MLAQKDCYVGQNWRSGQAALTSIPALVGNFQSLTRNISPSIYTISYLYIWMPIMIWMSAAIGVHNTSSDSDFSRTFNRLSLYPETSYWMLSHVLVVPPRMAETYGSKRFLFPLSTFLVFENQHLYLQEGQKVATEIVSAFKDSGPGFVYFQAVCESMHDSWKPYPRVYIK